MHINFTRVKFCGIIYDVNMFSNDSHESYIFKKGEFSSQAAVPFLKSMLQKSIRKGLKDHAVYACYTLLNNESLQKVTCNNGRIC